MKSLLTQYDVVTGLCLVVHIHFTFHTVRFCVLHLGTQLTTQVSCFSQDKQHRVGDKCSLVINVRVDVLAKVVDTIHGTNQWSSHAILYYWSTLLWKLTLRCSKTIMYFKLRIIYTHYSSVFMDRISACCILLPLSQITRKCCRHFEGTVASEVTNCRGVMLDKISIDILM